MSKNKIRHVGIVNIVKTQIGERYDGVMLASSILSGEIEHGTKLYTHPATINEDQDNLRSLLKELLEYAELGWDFTPDISVKVRAALERKS